MILELTIGLTTLYIIRYHLTGNKRRLRYERLRIGYKIAMNAAYGVRGFQTYQIPKGFDWDWYLETSRIHYQLILRG